MFRDQACAVPAWHRLACRWAVALFALTVGVSVGDGATAQAIYPADRTEILAGARFDFKVEFAKAPPEAELEELKRRRYFHCRSFTG